MLNTIYSILSIGDWICYILLVPCVFYLLFYAIASKFYHPKRYPETIGRKHFAVLFPAYRADNVIVSSVHSFLQQDYPTECYKIIVIADQMQEATCKKLRDMGAQVLVATYQNSSKAQALTLAMHSIDVPSFDMVVIMDADNTTTPHLLHELNKASAVGVRAIQAHRTAKNLNTDIALLDAASEEINNGIFRKGHVAIGFSCALIGSGMAFEADWFARHVEKLQTAGEDKELETLLQREQIYVDYLSEIDIYDEKTQKKEIIQQQRKRWIATQFGSLRATLPDLPKAVFSGNFSYADKILQWMLPPRIIQLAAVIGLTILATILAPFMGGLPGLALKWWILALAQISAMLLPLPASLANRRMLKAVLHIPVLSVRMIGNLFPLKGANKKFIHTEH